MKIPLFDNDLTLTYLKSGTNVHKDAFDFAFREVYGIDAHASEIVIHGMIDPQIITEVMKIHGLSSNQIEEKIEEAMNVMVSYFTSHLDEGEFEAIGGVKEMLLALDEESIPVGILTGNIEEIAWLKLKQAGIDELIEFGSFGNLARKRVDLIDIAAKRAKEAGVDLKGNEFCIVGDSIKDIECAKEGGIRVAAVATGVFSLEQLEKANPDLALQSFRGPRNLARFINFLKN